ncbi:FAD-binding oxidoreductase [soil metagenome]
MALIQQHFDALRTHLAPLEMGERDGRITVSPKSTDEVAALMRYANEQKLTIEILGAGTKRGVGNAVAADVLLDMTKLAGVVAHSWQDLTATVAAGTPWATMQRALAQHHQHVALDPLWPEIATVGGIIATNDSGALRLKYGSLRDLIIGMTIVLADGTVAKSGGKVVKNVAGYDLHKLMTGAFGTLGVITEVNFRLHPLPAETRAWTVTSAAAEPLGDLMLAVLDSQLSTQAMQLRADADGYALDVQLATLPEVLTLQGERLVEFARRAAPKTSGAFGALQILDSKLFAAREELFAEAGVVIKATMLPSAVAALSSEVVRLGGTAVTQATGIMFARFSEDKAATAISALRASIRVAGDGSLTVLRSAQGAISTWGDLIADPLTREIKRQFDPNSILNPGRFLGGI